MPYNLEGNRAKVQFVASADFPALIYKACLKTGLGSNTVYIQHAVAEALSRDLGLSLPQLIENLPPARGKAAVPFGADRKPVIGPGNTVEEVR